MTENDRGELVKRLREIAHDNYVFGGWQWDTLNDAIAALTAQQPSGVQEFQRGMLRAAEIANQDSMCDWVGGSTGSAVGTKARIVKAITRAAEQINAERRTSPSVASGDSPKGASESAPLRPLCRERGGAEGDFKTAC